MKKQIKLYRVVLNILFYILYVLIFSIFFSFIFPTILVLLWKSVFEPNNPIFSSIQISIFILVFVITLIFRKFFYLPIQIDCNNSIKKEVKNNVVTNEEANIKEKTIRDFPELDIKIGREIK